MEVASLAKHDVTSPELYGHFCMHAQLSHYQRRAAAAAIGLFIHTQVIIPDCTYRNCSACVRMQDSENVNMIIIIHDWFQSYSLILDSLCNAILKT